MRPGKLHLDTRSKVFTTRMLKLCKIFEIFKTWLVQYDPTWVLHLHWVWGNRADFCRSLSTNSVLPFHPLSGMLNIDPCNLNYYLFILLFDIYPKPGLTQSWAVFAGWPYFEQMVSRDAFPPQLACEPVKLHEKCWGKYSRVSGLHSSICLKRKAEGWLCYSGQMPLWEGDNRHEKSSSGGKEEYKHQKRKEDNSSDRTKNQSFSDGRSTSTWHIFHCPPRKPGLATHKQNFC